MSSKVVTIAALGVFIALAGGPVRAADTAVPRDDKQKSDVNLKAGPAGAIGMTPIKQPPVAKRRSTGARR